MPAREKFARDGALIVGGGTHGVLAMVRSLGRRGIPVWLAPDELHFAASSRYCTGILPWPGELTSQQQGEYLLASARRHHLEGWVLMTGSGAAAELIARHREMLAPVFRIVTSPQDVVREALDKRLTHALAVRAGVDHPQTWYPRDAEDLERLEVAFPAILKPSVKNGWNTLVRAKAWKVHDRDELVRRYRKASALVEPRSIMLQDLIPGGNENQYSYATLCREGVPLARLAARRMRQYPVEFGRASSLVETIDLPELEATGQRVLAALNFSGIAEVEFKRDPRDSRLKLLDINPRAWRWMSLGERAGVDFTYLFYQLARGEVIEPVSAAVGIRWVRMATDIVAAAHEMWHGATTPHGYLRSLSGPLEFSTFARDDPIPALAEVPHLAAVELRRSRLVRQLRRALSRRRAPETET